MSRALAAANTVLTFVERAASSVATLLMFVIMVIVTADVFMRYALNRPFSFTYDLVGLYLLAGVFFFTLSDAFRDHAHVSVDILVSRFPPSLRRVTEVLVALCALFVFVLITWIGYERAIENYQNGEVVAGSIPWPTWMSTVLVPIGGGLLVLRLLMQLIGHVASLLTGRDLYPLPPIIEIGEARSFE